MRSLIVRHSAAVTLFVALAIIGFAVAQASSRAAAGAAADRALPDWALKTALAVAAADGDAAPDSVHYAVTTPARIAAVADEKSIDTETQLLAVLMRGHFVLNTAHLPADVEPPDAEWILLVLDPRDQTVAGMAAAKGEPDASALGPLVDVTVEAQ